MTLQYTDIPFGFGQLQVLTPQIKENTIPKRLIWIDCETTGLDRDDYILEIAVGVSLFNNPFNTFQHVYNASFTLKQCSKSLCSVHPTVIRMHTTNGLLEDCSRSTVTHEDAQAQIIRELKLLHEHEDQYLAGSAVHSDRMWLSWGMPKLEKLFSHRHYDISSLKLFCQSLGMLPIPKGEAHRAKADIEESVAHAKICHDWLKTWFTTDRILER